ncbi:g1029 [Coccomyxa elongata]
MIHDVQDVIWQRYFTRHVLPHIVNIEDRVRTRSATAKSLYVQTEHFPYASLLSRSHSKVLAIGIEAEGLLRELASAALDERVLVVTERQAEAPRGAEMCAPEAARPRTETQRFDIVFTEDARCDLAPGVRHVEIVSDTRHRTGDDTEVDFVFATGPAIRPPVCGDIRRRFMPRLLSAGVFSPFFRLLVLSDPRCMAVLDITANALESGRICDRIFRTRLREIV